MNDLISRQAAIDAIEAKIANEFGKYMKYNVAFNDGLRSAVFALEKLLSAEPEISRIEQELHGKTPEEQYEFLYCLLLKFGLAYTDSRLAVIEWLRGEKEDG